MSRKSRERRERMRNAVTYLQRYVVNYTQQEGYESYDDAIFIDDILYGLGVALDKQQYEYAQGYDKFKERLRKHLSGGKD